MAADAANILGETQAIGKMPDEMPEKRARDRMSNPSQGLAMCHKGMAARANVLGQTMAFANRINLVAKHAAPVAWPLDE